LQSIRRRMLSARLSITDQRQACVVGGVRSRRGTLATASGDDTVRLWDVAMGEERRALADREGTGVVGGVRRGRGARRHRWRRREARLRNTAFTDADQVKRQICQALHWDFTPEERSQFPRHMPSDHRPLGQYGYQHHITMRQPDRVVRGRAP
jgi:hypothetical protein